MEPYDIAVIGGGPGGNAAVEQVVLRGGRACLIEAHRLGGTCLNVGCMPTKAMLAASELYHRAGQAGPLGLNITRQGVDGRAFMRRILDIRRFLQNAIDEKLTHLDGLDVICGRGRLQDARTIIVDTADGERTITARAIVIATGSTANRPSFLPWSSPRLMTNVEAVSRDDLPASILIMGGGALGCEFACMYAELGIGTHVVEVAEQLLPRMPEDVSQAAHRFLTDRGVDVRTGMEVTNMDDAGLALRVALSDSTELSVDASLIAVGRTPNSADLGLETLGVDMDDDVIKVDERCRTNVEGLYAVGDVAERRRHSHLAARMGVVAAENIMGMDARDDRRIVPVSVYIHPEIACVGLCGEDEPRDLPDGVSAYTYDFEEGGMAMLKHRLGGRLNVLAKRASGRIGGASWIGPGAVDHIHEIALAMRHGLTLADIGKTIHAHPSFAEACRGVAESWIEDKLTYT